MMQGVPGLAALSRQANLVKKFAAKEPILTQTAIAAAIKNRLVHGDSIDANAILHFGDETPGDVRSFPPEISVHCLAAHRSSLAKGVQFHGDAGFADYEFCKAFGVVCLLWCGEYDDPTHGATCFHKHDETPVWARSRLPQALIGHWMFY